MPSAIFIPAQLNDLSVDVSLGAPAQGAVLYRGATKWNALGVGTSGQYLTSGGAGANPSWTTAPADTDSLATLTDVSLAGTAQGDLPFRGATAWNNLAAGTSGQFLKTQGVGANPVWATLPGDTDTFAALTDVTLTTPAQGDTYYRNAAGNVVNLAPGTAGQYLRSGGAAANPTWATFAVDTDTFAALADVTLTTPAQGDVYYRNAAGIVVNLAPGTSGQVLATGGAAANPAWATVAVPSLTPAVILAPAASGRNVILPTADATPLTLQRFSLAAASDLLVLNDQTSAALARFDHLGDLGIGIAPTYGFHLLGGSGRLQALATPAAPTVTPTGVTGSTTYMYTLVAYDRLGNSAATSPTGMTTTGNATLSGSNFNAITWPAVPGAATYDLLKNDMAHSLALGLTVTSFNDTGQAVSAYSNLPTRNMTADLTVDGWLVAPVTISRPAINGGSALKLLTIFGPADSNLLAGSEAINVSVALGQIQFATGALPTQRAVVISNPTYTFVGASTITTAATLALVGAPVAGTNATITNSYALWVQSGNTNLAGSLALAGAPMTEVLNVKGNVSMVNPSGTAMRSLTPTGLGYNPATYPVTVVGPVTGLGAVSLSFDPSVIAGGNFSGTGIEVICRRGVIFITPNVGATDWDRTLWMQDQQIGIGLAPSGAQLDVQKDVIFRRQFGMPSIRTDSWIAISGPVPATVTGINNVGIFFDPAFGTNATNLQTAMEFRVRQMAAGGATVCAQAAAVQIDPMVVGTNWTVNNYADIRLSGTTTGTVNVGILDGASPASGNWALCLNSTRASYLGTGGVGIGMSMPVMLMSQLSVQASGPTIIGQIIEGAAAQTANLSQWQDNAAGLLLDVTAAGDLEIRRKDSTTEGSLVGSVVGSFNSNTHASYTGRVVLNAADFAGARECMRMEGTGTVAALAFYGHAVAVQPTVSGSRGANAALASLLTALASQGLVIDSSTV